MSQLFTTKDGINCRPINPYQKPTLPCPHDILEQCDCEKWANFEMKIVPYHILSDEPIKTGDFKGNLVWQYKNPAFGGVWVTVDFEPNNSTHETRQAVQPVPVKGEEKVPSVKAMVGIDNEVSVAAKAAVELFHKLYGHLVVSDKYDLYQEIFANAFYFGREYATNYEGGSDAEINEN